MYYHLPIFLSFQSTSRDLDLLLPRSSNERTEPELIPVNSSTRSKPLCLFSLALCLFYMLYLPNLILPLRACQDTNRRRPSSSPSPPFSVHAWGSPLAKPTTGSSSADPRWSRRPLVPSLQKLLRPQTAPRWAPVGLRLVQLHFFRCSVKYS
jgi:hypothetical protein